MSVVDRIAASAYEVAARVVGVGPSESEERAITWDDVTWGSSSKTATGKAVTQDNSMQLVAVWACVSLISDALSSTPLKAYRESDDGMLEPMESPPRWVVEPNTDMSSYEFWTRSMTSVLLDGNAFYLVSRGPRGISELIPLHPGDVTVDIDRATMRRTYRVNGTPVDRRQLLHVPGLVLPGEARGLSPIAAAKEAVGLGMSAEEYGARFFANGATMSGVVETPGALTEDQAKVMARTFAQRHSGLENSHLPGVLTGGAAWKPITIPPEQAQFLETRRFQTSEIARLFRVPPHLIGDVERSTSWGSGIEEQNRSYLQFTLSPWVTRFEQALSAMAPSGTVVRFDMNQILRGTKKERYETYNIGIQAGFLVADEARAEEGMKPLPDGKGAEPRPAPNESPGAPGDDSAAPTEPAQTDTEDEARSRELRHPGHEDQGVHGKWAHGGSATVSDSDAARLADSAVAGGFTFDPRAGADVTSGFAVSPFPERTQKVPADSITGADIQSYAKANSDLLSQDTNMIGAWNNEGTVYLDVTVVMSSQSAAAAVGKKYNQISMMNLDTLTEVPLGGTGEA